ncbi:MAG: DUF4388 domain-containing protein [Anaerolineae bacterium]|nr:MAG: DUF4388 domain-containing protein [Anaerolineae bacterium]
MALKGNLRDFTITQLLNLVNLAQKTGSLIIEGPSETATITFREGKLAYAQVNTEDGGLGAILHKSNVISTAQYGTLKARAASMNDKELGLLLINSGYVSQEDILASLQTHFVDIIQRLFSWVEGIFHFDNDILVPGDKIPVKLDLENIIIEGSRRLREWEQLKDELPNLELALKFTDRPGVNLKNINLSVEEWKVVSFINPKNTIGAIAKANKMSELDIRRIVYGLLQAGLVELIRPEGVEQTLPGIDKAMPGKNKEEQKNLVNRLIGRIRSL